MIRFSAIIKKFGRQGEKTGWTYIEIPEKIAQQIFPGNKKTFRVKGKLDKHPVEQVALLPMGDGTFILPINADMRKSIRKQKGDNISVELSVDKREIKPPAEFIDCLRDEAEALAFYQSLSKGNQNYFTKWIESAKTEPTRTKRIAQAINGLAAKQDFGMMLRALKKKRMDEGI